jgi:hypothetical protein
MIFIIISIILTIIIIVLIFNNKLPIFNSSKGIMELSPREGDNVSTNNGKSCNINITDNCGCTVINKLSDDTIEKSIEPLNSYQIESNYYKIKQDLIPLWSDWDNCERQITNIGIKDLYTKNRFSLTYNESDASDECNMIECKNLGAVKLEDQFNKNDKKGTEICDIKRNPGNNEKMKKYTINTQKCIPYTNLLDDSRPGLHPFHRVNQENSREIKRHLIGITKMKYSSSNDNFENKNNLFNILSTNTGNYKNANRTNRYLSEVKKLLNIN